MGHFFTLLSSLMGGSDSTVFGILLAGVVCEDVAQSVRPCFDAVTVYRRSSESFLGKDSQIHSVSTYGHSFFTVIFLYLLCFRTLFSF